MKYIFLLYLCSFVVNSILAKSPPPPPAKNSKGAPTTRPGKQQDENQFVHYCYHEKDGCGPSSKSWPDICRSGRAQSPIELPIEASRSSVRLVMRLEAYRASSFKIMNNGHSVNINFKYPPTNVTNSTKEQHDLVVNNMNDQEERKYKLASLHFHWGRENGSGSEHLIGGKTSELELHLVHHWLRYPNLSAAIESGHPNALAVVGVIFHVTQNKTSSNATAFKALKPLVDNLKKVKDVSKNGSFVVVNETLDFTSLLRTTDSPEFWAYDGSLTTPGCQEVVAWFLHRRIAMVAQSDVEKFRKSLSDSKGKSLDENVKPVSPLNGRNVTITKGRFYMTEQHDVSCYRLTTRELVCSTAI